MASQTGTLDSLGKRLKSVSDSDALLGIAVLMILSVMLLPLPSVFLDLFLSANISVGFVILLTAIYTRRVLEFSIFPSLLLITTLFRLALNVASTRLILLHGEEGTAAAGRIINAFGQFVVGGNYVIGAIIFIILVIVNFVVITKGTERISEVAARFTLDAMPGKQMSIDADLNAGLIGEQDAKRRREEIREEADLYGAMDGASKFVRGDAIAGILITVINIVGGLIIGVAQKDMVVTEALKNYTLLTIGDGLVSQIPALIISTSTGILVSRAKGEGGLGEEFGKQLGLQPKPLILAGGMLFFLAVIPGFPPFPLLVVGSVLLGGGYVLSKKAQAKKGEPGAPQLEEGEAGAPASGQAGELPPPLDTLEMELGYGLIPLVDESQDGDLLGRIRAIRQQLAMEYGIIVPALHVRDNLQLKPTEYRLLLRGNTIARAELMLGHFLALSPGESTKEIQGVATQDPAFGMPALWIPENRQEEALQSGYTVIDLSTVVATHLTELFKKHADELLTRQTTQQLLDSLSESQPRLVEELTPNLLSVGIIQKTLQNLIRERVSIRDLQTICETLADNAPITKDPDILTEYVRQRLARTITRSYEGEDGKLHVLTLHPSLEERLSKHIQKTEQGAFLALDPEFMQQLVQVFNREVRKALTLGHHPVVLCSPMVRRHLRRLLERFLPEIVLISHTELHSALEIQSIGMIAA